MRVFRKALLISSAVLFSIACSTSETTNQNANQSAPAASITNANAAPTSGSNANPEPASMASASANSNQPIRPVDEKKKDDKAGTAKPASNLDGAALFTANKCATCHGVDGKGKIKDARDFTDAAWQKKESDAELASVIKNGKKPMPPYGDKLTADEIKALVAYVRTFGKK